MGLFVDLYVNTHDISPESWEKTYQESLLLLERFPLPLMRLQREEIRGQKRYVFTTHLIENKDTPDEHWEVEGDLLSYQRAEPFQLSRYHKQHDNKHDDKNVLWANEEELEYVDGNGIKLFGNKTQGYPYHFAMLAVGILFENRFPHNIFVTGDIDRIQAESVIAWMNTVLATPVIMPICLDGQKLYRQLDAIYDDGSLAIRRFQTLFRDSEEEQLHTLLRYADKNLVIQDIVETLCEYSQLSQLGVIGLISQFLNVTQDINQLIDIILKVGKVKPEFNLEELLRVLGNKFITIDKKEREPLFIFLHSADNLITMEDTFSQLLLTLAGAPSFIDFYLTHSELLAIFSTYQPANSKKFEQIIAASEKKCREELEQTKTLIREMEKKTESADGDKIETTESVVSQQKSYSPEEEYIIEQAYLQQKEYKQPEKFAQQMGVQLQLIIQKHSKFFTSEEKEYYLEMIYKTSFENGFVLRESAWQRIDQEQDVNVLKSLFAFSMISERETNFWNWRCYIMEHSHLWQYLIDDSNVKIGTTD